VTTGGIYIYIVTTGGIYSNHWQYIWWPLGPKRYKTTDLLTYRSQLQKHFSGWWYCVNCCLLDQLCHSLSNISEGHQLKPQGSSVQPAEPAGLNFVLSWMRNKLLYKIRNSPYWLQRDTTLLLVPVSIMQTFGLTSRKGKVRKPYLVCPIIFILTG